MLAVPWLVVVNASHSVSFKNYTHNKFTQHSHLSSPFVILETFVRLCEKYLPVGLLILVTLHLSLLFQKITSSFCLYLVHESVPHKICSCGYGSLITSAAFTGPPYCCWFIFYRNYFNKFAIFSMIFIHYKSQCPA
jgi:hypothetical protein